MKKLILVASLALVAAVVAPIGSASANVTGVCEIEGPAKFTTLEKEKKLVTYSFTSSKVTCNTVPAAEKGKVTVSGEAELSCTEGLGGLGGVGKAGSGEVEYTTGGKVEKHKFTFKFQARLNQVVLTAEGEVTAGGRAEFPLAAIEPCEKNGAKELSFTSTAAGSF
jgi:hypothetical protein